MKVNADNLGKGKHFWYRGGVYVMDSDEGATNVKTGMIFSPDYLPDKVTPVEIKNVADLIK